jgi:hypothetical protein
MNTNKERANHGPKDNQSTRIEHQQRQVIRRERRKRNRQRQQQNGQTGQ